MTKIFEIIMLLCFGAAWPASIAKSYTSKTTKGKSLLFLSLLLIGYVAGMINKIINGIDYVLYFYILNFIMVGTDILLYMRNSMLEKKSSM
jgi:hypothetical protein